MALGGRSPTKADREWMDAISGLGCIVCHLDIGVDTPAEVHHIDGKTKPGAHRRSIPLCYLHHRAGLDNEQATSRHPYKRRFEDRYGSEELLLEQTRMRIEGQEDGDGLEW